MKLTSIALRISATSLAVAAANAQTISEINGNKFLSPFQNRNVANVTGLVTAKGPDGFWIRSTAADTDPRTSESVYVFGRAAVGNVSTGDIVSLNGRVAEYRSNNAYLFLTEITNPTSIRVSTRNNSVTPLVLGENGLSPPTEQFTSLDNGDVYGVPNNASLVSRSNLELEPTKYGLDFWEALSGELVTIKQARAISKPNSFGDTWVVGSWKTTGGNRRGGLTMTAKDSNPEAIIIGTPLDGTRNPNTTRLGDTLSDITGVVFNAFGSYRILPLTGIKVVGSQLPDLPLRSRLYSLGLCGGLSIGDYNVENLAPDSDHLPKIADHIVNYLNTPDIVFLQEIQDNTGPENDGIVSANQTLSTLSEAIRKLNPRVNYAYVTIDPVNNQDGGQPGGNIRPAYLYNPSVVRLAPGQPGTSIDTNEVIAANRSVVSYLPLPISASPSLKYNPGLIDPTNPAFNNSRKPLVAKWETVVLKRPFFTINIHGTSKGGSSALEGDARPPVNGGLSSRTAQNNITATFIQQILSIDKNAAIITAGDFNEFSFVQPLTNFLQVSGLRDLDVVTSVPETERYTYLFDMNCQQLDHIFVSPSIATRLPRYEHVHVNTWVSLADQVSDHDPSVALVNVC